MILQISKNIKQYIEFIISRHRIFHVQIGKKEQLITKFMLFIIFIQHIYIATYVRLNMLDINNIILVVNFFLHQSAYEKFDV